MRDWNENGKKDMGDRYIEYNLTKGEEEDSFSNNLSNNSQKSMQTKVSIFIAVVILSIILDIYTKGMGELLFLAYLIVCLLF